MLPFLTRLSSSFRRHLPSCASFFFSPHAGGGHDPGPTLSPAPFGASWPRVPGEPQQQWDTHRAPPEELGLGPPPQSPCVVPPPHVRVPGAGTRAPSAGWPRVEAQRCRLRPPIGRQQNTVYGSAQPAGERGKAQSKAHPQLGSTSPRGLQRCFVPLCCGVGWQDPRTHSGLAPQDPSCPGCFVSPNQRQWGSAGSPSWKGDIQGGQASRPPAPAGPHCPSAPCLGWLCLGGVWLPTALGASPACPGFVHPSERCAGWGCGSEAEQGRGVAGQNWSGSASPLWRLRGLVPSTP